MHILVVLSEVSSLICAVRLSSEPLYSKYVTVLPLVITRMSLGVKGSGTLFSGDDLHGDARLIFFPFSLKSSWNEVLQPIAKTKMSSDEHQLVNDEYKQTFSQASASLILIGQ